MFSTDSRHALVRSVVQHHVLGFRNGPHTQLAYQCVDIDSGPLEVVPQGKRKIRNKVIGLLTAEQTAPEAIGNLIKTA